MLILINAFKSITRSKGRNILIGIIVVAIAAASCVALAIRNAANDAELAGLDSLYITGSISVDRQRLMESMQGGDALRGDRGALRGMITDYQGLNLDELTHYAQSEHVSGFYYTTSISLDASGELEAYGSDGGGDAPGLPGGLPDIGRDGRGGGGMNPIGGIALGALGDFTVAGYSSLQAMTKFADGTAMITDGEMFDAQSNEMNCIISSELAFYNDLSVGDVITLVNPNVEDETYDLTIAGIYVDTESGDMGGQLRFSTSQDPANLIGVSHNTLQIIMDSSASSAVVETTDFGFEISTALSGQLSGTFVFNDKDDYDGFAEELTAMGLPEQYALLSSDISSYESAVIPLRNLSEYAATLLLIVLAIGVVILVVINVFNIRERKYEVGVLTAIGIKKGKVAMQFVTELLCVTLVAIVIGAVIGAAISVPVSNELLSAQIEQVQSQTPAQEETLGGPGFGGGRGNWQMAAPIISAFMPGNQTEVSYLDKIDATISFSIISQLIGIGIILTLVSSFAAVVFVMRYEPLKILASRA